MIVKNDKTTATNTSSKGDASGTPKSVHFGNNSAVEHDKSMKALRVTKSPETSKLLKPKKAALKKGRK